MREGKALLLEGMGCARARPCCLKEWDVRGELPLAAWAGERARGQQKGVTQRSTDRSSRSKGMPWGLLYLVPRMVVMPRLVAMMSTGARSLSSARFSQLKHSMSSMCTSSTNSTPGMTVAFPSSRHSATLASICSLTSLLISPVSPANSARKPCTPQWSADTPSIPLRKLPHPVPHLGPRVDDVNVVQVDRVHHLLPLLNLTLRALRHHPRSEEAESPGPERT